MARMIITRCFKSYNIDAHNHYEYTPLIAAAEEGEDELCRLLCERGDVDVDKGNKYGATPLHLVAYHDRMECMRTLLDVGKANVHAKSKSSSTPLHFAALNGSIEAATLLLERGAEINPLSCLNQTPLGHAHQYNIP